MVRFVLTALVALQLGACSSVNQRVSNATLGSTNALVTTGNIRLVTERIRVGEAQPVVCTEPSPDYAVAFSHNTTGKLVASSPVLTPAGTGAGEQSLDVSGGRDYREQVEQGEGRAAAVLALRDGLYAACQSYANGIIGRDSYAMILSQYGSLLVSLVGGGKTVVDTSGKVIVAGAGATTIDGRQASLSTLMVACISSYDPSRLGSGGQNPLLTKRLCDHVFAAVLRRAGRA